MHYLISKIGIATCVFGLLITACVPADSAFPSDSSVCTPKAPYPNIYLSLTPAAPIPSNLSNVPYTQYDRHQALITLTNQVKNWSSSSDINLDNDQIIRITVTFISPEIAQMAIYNQLLYYPIQGVDFKTPLDKGMESLAKRDEFIFLVLITASDNVASIPGKDVITLDIPIREMLLTNTADLAVRPNHDDHLLDEEIHLENGDFIAGFLGYPIAVGNESNCREVMEPGWNTSVTIRIPSYSIDGEQIQNPLTWNISYRTLIDLGGPQAVPTMNYIPSDIAAELLPANKPPNPVKNIPETDIRYWGAYWQKLARFVWWQVIYYGNQK